MLPFDYRSGRAMANWNDLKEQRVVELEQKVGGFGERFDAVDKRLDAMDRKFEELLTKADLKAFMAEMASQVRTAAEGYGATLESIDRRLKRMSTQIRTKDRDRDLVLKDHGKRISALERR